MSRAEPGTWHVLADGNVGYRDWLGYGLTRVADVRPGPERLAHARLIAASPGLLRTLRQIAALGDDQRDAEDARERMARLARLAISTVDNAEEG